MEYGFVIMYCKDGVLYPVALTETQHGIMQQLIAITLDGKVVCDFNSPQGKAVNMIEQIRTARHCTIVE